MLWSLLAEQGVFATDGQNTISTCSRHSLELSTWQCRDYVSDLDNSGSKPAVTGLEAWVGEEVNSGFRHHSPALKSPGHLQSKVQTPLSLADPTAWHHPSRLLWPLPFPSCSHPELPCLSQTLALSTLSGLDSTQSPTSLPGSYASEKARLELYLFCETF